MLKTLKMNKSKIPVQEFKLAAETGTTHPNKVPFKCALFHCDKPSDASPHGAGGKLIQISSTVASRDLHTFIGMALNIDYANGMADHDPRFKVAVIEKAELDMQGTAWIEGYIYAKDFPEVVATIRHYNGMAAEYNWSEYQFGASLEMEAAVTVSESDENILEVLEFCGTGAAILFAEAAAYQTSSFAARRQAKEEEDYEMTAEEVKAMQEMMTKLQEGMTNIAGSVEKVAGKVETIEGEVSAIKAANESATPPIPETPKTPVTPAAETEELKAAREETERLKKEVNDLKAAAAEKPVEPERKTATAAQLLAKHGGTFKDEDVSDHRSFCAAVDQMGLDSTQSIMLKMRHKETLQKTQ